MDVTLRDGAKIKIWHHRGLGAPMVFLYGLGCSIKHWKYQLEHQIESGRTTIYFDYRGHGESTLGRPPRPLTIKTLSQDVAEILNILDIHAVIIVGQSMGGTIALQFAHDYPSIAKGLILQGSPGRNPLDKMLIGDTGITLLKLLIQINKFAPQITNFINKSAGQLPLVAREMIRAKGFNPQLANTDDIEEYVRYFFASDPQIFYELAEDLQDFDITQMDHIIDLPTLILAGALDTVIPLEECKWLAKRLPMSELEIIPHGSHCPHLEDPKWVNQRIDRFLKTFNL